MASRTAIEQLRDDQAELGRDYGLAYHNSYQELWRVTRAWDYYEALFGSPERVDLLNRVSGPFWGTIQTMLLEHTLLGICRLTDPAGKGAKRNLSVWTLVEFEPSKHKKRLQSRAKLATDRTRFARTWRDKRIAHNDYDQITNTLDKLSPASALRIRKGLSLINEVFRWIQGKHFNGDIGLLETGDLDATHVMSVMDDGLRYDELRDIAYHSGEAVSGYDPKYDWLHTGPDPRERYQMRLDRQLPRPLRRQ